jgi:hypothetical protein
MWKNLKLTFFTQIKDLEINNTGHQHGRQNEVKGISPDILYQRAFKKLKLRFC